MEYEKLALKIGAVKAGLAPVSPPVLKGSSGVEHRFTLLFSRGATLYGFDFYESVTEVDVIKSYIKKYDSRAVVNMVCLSEKTPETAGRLAIEYGMRILSPAAAANLFVLETAVSRSPFS